MSFVWLLPAAFLVHDLEELITWRGWVDAHWTELESIARSNSLAADLINSVPKNASEFAIGVGLLFAVFLVAAWLIWIGRGQRRVSNFIYEVLLGGFCLHGFTHVAQAGLFTSYTPGLVTSLTVVIPVSLYIGKRLIEARSTNIYELIVASIIGILLFVPAVLLIFQLV